MSRVQITKPDHQGRMHQCNERTASGDRCKNTSFIEIGPISTYCYIHAKLLAKDINAYLQLRVTKRKTK